MKYKTIRLRLGKELLSKLKRAALHYEYNHSDIARAAIKKWHRLNPTLKEVKDSGGTVETLFIQPWENGIDNKTLKGILNWYLTDYLDYKPQAKIIPIEAYQKEYDMKIASLITQELIQTENIIRGEPHV